MVTIHSLTYLHPNKDLLFADLDLVVNKQNKIALIGNNGTGKSTLLKILAGELQPSGGTVRTRSKPYYVPQLLGNYDSLTVAQALGVTGKLKALHAILNGEVTDENLSILDDDWIIADRCNEALAYWGLDIGDLSRQMCTLSGGQKTKIFLAGISIHRAEIILMDEPSNHLDSGSRELLYNYIRQTKNTLLVVSHDRILLNLLDTTCELGSHGITTYGGNYEFYLEQKIIARGALDQDIKSKEKALRKAKEIERETIERQQKLDARGKQKQLKAGVPTIFMNTLRNNAEKSTSRIKGIHTEKIGSIAQELSQLRKELPDIDKMKLDLDSSALHKGKTLTKAEQLNFSYAGRSLWQAPLNFVITSGDRIALKGPNGSGKTTLIRILLGDLEPTIGKVTRNNVKAIYIDQDHTLINNKLSVYQQAQQFDPGDLQEHDIRTRLNRSLFTSDDLDKPCSALSGGEKMRLILCCLTIGDRSPDMIILDEPTNNLDIQNIEILTAAINGYKGTLIVVSHDEYFLTQIGTDRSIILS